MFLPTNKKEMIEAGWDSVDIILITGDAYVDHPSYGAACIGRVLENAGFKVGIIAQPDWRTINDFKALGIPRLFCGIASGNLDSMVANYTASLKKRKSDEYSPKNALFTRPDRAVIVYANRAKEAFPGIPIIIGGIEASLRRFGHYDYWSNSIKRSILLDSKADILVYGMGERQTLEIARKLHNREHIDTCNTIKGTVIARSSLNAISAYRLIPSYEEISSNKNLFNEACRIIQEEADPYHGKTVVQKHQNRFVIQLPSADPLSTEEMDTFYELPFMRDMHPIYKKAGGIPGFEAVKFSVISHRGCPGECAFCSLSLHQGRIIQSRSIESILKEISIIAQKPDFKGTITDIGGPTANLYMAVCAFWKDKKGACKNKKCLYPKKCNNLLLGYDTAIKLLNKSRTIQNINHVFIGSGLRYDLLIEPYADAYMHTLCSHHISGQLKVAPEHISKNVLKLMAKAHPEQFDAFSSRFYTLNKKLNKKQYLVNYFITAHPGSTLDDALELSLYLKHKKIYPEQIQDFIPLPMTMAGCMYYTEMNPYTGEKIYVAKTAYERKLQRAVVQYRNIKNKIIIQQAAQKLKNKKLLRVLST